MFVESRGRFLEDKCMKVTASVNYNTTSAKLCTSSNIRGNTNPRPCSPGEARDFEGKCRPICSNSIKAVYKSTIYYQ
jgi:hypothetical protein